MRNLEERLIGRWSGPRIVAISLIAGAAGVLPLALYMVFGPANGNPIGLGLLAVVAVPIAAGGMLVGAIKALIERFTDRGM